MTLSAKTIYTGRWGAVVAPSNETELVESRTARKLSTNGELCHPSDLLFAATAFQARILEATEDLQRAMLGYVVAASDASSMSSYILP
jgi:hypothetical protein